MYFYQRKTSGLAIYSYVIGDRKTKECAVIDPVRDVAPYLAFAKKEGLTISHILETHVHADFVSGSKELKERLGGKASVHCSAMGGEEWLPKYADHRVKDGASLRMGALRLQALHTPGHTPEHLSWLLFDEGRSGEEPLIAFTGDFLFVGSIGRPDLLGEEEMRSLASQLYASVFKRLPELPEFTEIYPAHGAGSLCGKALASRDHSTIGYERRFNSALAVKPEEEWKKALMAEMPKAPPYFSRMKRINVEGAEPIEKILKKLRPYKTDEVKEALILDIRTKEAFASLHIPGSINIPAAANFSTWAGWLLPDDRPIVAVLDSPEQMEEIALCLLRVGFDRIAGYLEGGITAWEDAGLPPAHIGILPVEELAQREEDFCIIDVRSEEEWNRGHIEGARHIELGGLEKEAKNLPQKPLAVICQSGSRASIGASLLKKEGFKEVYNVLGGMSAWNRKKVEK